MATPMNSVPIATVPTLAVEHPLHNPHYRRWLIGGTISRLGDQFYLVALPWLILQQTGSPVAMGAVMTAGSIPQVVFMLMGGAVSDRVSARKILMTAAAARTIWITVIAFLISLGALHIWELYALAIAFGVADAFVYPAAMAYLPFLVKSEQLVPAMSLSQTSMQLTNIVGPVPAGFVIKTLGVAWAFFLDAISFLFIIGALWKLPDPPESQAARKPVLQSIIEGIACVGRDTTLRSLVLLVTILTFCMIGPATVGLPYLIKTRFGSPAAYGVIIAAAAAGSVLGTLLAGVWKIRRRGAMFLLVPSIVGLCLGLTGLAGTVWSIAGVQLVMGAMAGIFSVHVNAWFMQRVDAAIRSRMMSVLMFASLGLMPISLALSGFLVAWNMKSVFLLAGGIVLLSTAAASLQRRVREIE